MPIDPADVPKTTIITYIGSHVFHYSTFCLKNSGAAFQCMMDSIFGEIPKCLIYMDELLMFSANNSEYELHFWEVLSLLRENRLILRQDKCTFAAPIVDFLGHRINTDHTASPIQS